METSNIATIARQWAWLLVLAALVAGLAGHLSASVLPVTHESRVRLLVGPVAASNDDIRAAGNLARTYGELVTAEDVLDRTIAALDLPLRPSQLRGAIRPTADSGTRMLIVRVRDADPDRAALIADELAVQLQRLANQGVAAGRLQVVDSASPGAPVGVSTTLIVSFAAFAGLVAALVIIILLENVRQTLRSPEELVEVTGVDYLGSVAAPTRLQPSQGFVVDSDPDSARAGDYRMLATKIELLAAREHLRSLLVLGVHAAHSAGETAANLALILSERSHTVTLLDANAESREISSLLGLLGRPGVTDLLERYDRLDAELDPAGFLIGPDPRLFVVPIGHGDGQRPPNTASVRWLLSGLPSQPELLMVNAAPVHRSAASLVWAGAVDGTILVVPRNRAERGPLLHLVQSLRMAGANPIGVVFEERRHILRVGVPVPSLPWRTGWRPASVKEQLLRWVPGASSRDSQDPQGRDSRIHSDAP